MSKSFKKTPKKFDDDFFYGVDDIDIRDKKKKNHDERRATKEFLREFDSGENRDRERSDR